MAPPEAMDESSSPSSKKRSLEASSPSVAEARTDATTTTAASPGVQVCSPPPRKKIHDSESAASPLGGEDDDDGLMVVSSTLVNPNVDYPHGRRDCGKFPFSMETAPKHCSKCYCHACDVPVSECPSWDQHCRREPVIKDHSISTGEVTVLETARVSAGAAAFLRNRLNGGGGRRQVGYRMYDDYDPYGDGEDEWGGMGGLLPSQMRDRSSSRRGGGGNKNERAASSKRITDILAEKLNLMVKITDSSSDGNDESVNRILSDENYLKDMLSSSQGTPTPVAQNLKMEGDVQELRLHNSFFVEGIRIGWPFSTILTPQRQMAIHIVKALKRKLHVVLESPTGTGKSAAILCSVLAWQRYHAKTSQAKKQQRVEEISKEMADSSVASMFKKAGSDTEKTAVPREEVDDDRDVGVVAEPDVPTVIYCSRTHSQVAQMVASLQKTPYRPRMTVLGSRERLCINKELRGDGEKKVSNAFLNQACRDRKLETDKKRKEYFKKPAKGYDDDDPDPFPVGDAAVDEFEEEPAGENNNATSGQQQLDGSTPTGNRRRWKNKPTCSHYQQLSTFRAARAVKERFIKSAESVNGCCKGGEQTKLGVLDIEDLIEFGKNPDRETGISLYREPANTGSFGITMEVRKAGGCQIAGLKPDGAAAKDGRIRSGDWIQAINGVSVKTWNLDQMKHRIVNLSKDPLILTVQRTDAPVYEDEDENNEDVTYSDHSLCPYYLSRALMPSANLIFAPYNYVLDPAIRRTLNLDLKGSVVVLDEAHNIEDTLCESGSGDYGEINLCNLLSVLARYSNQKTSVGSDPSGNDTMVELMMGGGEQSMSSVAHELVLFLEKVVNYMRTERKKFETGPALNNVKKEHSRFRLSDDHSVEVSYSGPSGFGIRGKAVGCGPKLEEFGYTSEMYTRLSNLAGSLEQHLFGGKNDVAESNQTSEAVMNDLMDFISKFELASKHPEHFYLAFNMKPNGNIDYATQMDDGEYAELISNQRWRKHPRQLPCVSPRTDAHPNIPLPVCNHESCKSKNAAGYFVGDAKRHGEMCNGDRPLWECNLSLRLLSPGLLMSELSTQCRSVILASGSLAPLPSLCSELNLYPPKATVAPAASSATPTKQPLSQSSMVGHKSNIVNLLSPATRPTPVKPAGSMLSPNNKKPKELVGRLQVKPSPLEANHVINLKKQLLACAIGHFPDGKPLTVNYSNYKEESFFPRLGNALASVIEAVPSGGVLVFVPSYSFLNKCVKCWNPTAQQMTSNFSQQSSMSPQIWARLIQSKTKVIVESTGSQDKFEAARDEYREQVRLEKKCILLAVFRGKMSEGISFNDDNARAVVCIGCPFPNSFDRNIKAKKAYNDEQRKISKNTSLLPGNEWYSQQAYRAIAQALGRCIRHGADYGTVILMDSRHCDDGSPNDGIPSRHKSLPKWMRNSMRTLSMRPHTGVGVDPILGGYQGLGRELQSFFRQAPPYADGILSKWKLDLETAQKKAEEAGQRTFDSATGQWQVSTKKGGSGTGVKAEL